MYLTGYSVSVIKCGINVKEEIPDFKVGRDILNFFQISCYRFSLYNYSVNYYFYYSFWNWDIGNMD